MESQHVGTHQGEEVDHQEKSVLQKVKEKARKIKNKLTKRGHGHEQDHRDPDEEDDEEEEEDLEVPGATTTGSRATGQGDILKVPMAEFGDTKAAATHDHDPKVPHSEKTDPMKDCVPAASQRTRQSIQPGVTPMHDEVLEPSPNYHASTTESLVGHDQIPSQQPKVDFGKTSVKGEAPHAPQNTPLPSLGEYKSKGADQSQAFVSGKEGHLGQSREHTPVSYSDLGEHRTNAADPSPTSLSSSERHLGQSGVHTPVSSLGGDDQKTIVADTRQTSVTGKEGHSGQTGVHGGLDDRTPISSRGDYQKTDVTDPSHTSATGNEGHFGQSEVNLDRPRVLEEDPNAHMADPQAFTPSNDQTEVTDPTNAGGNEVGITPIVRSFDKMNIHAGDTKPSNQGSRYTEKVSFADKATSAKNAVASTLGYGGGNSDQHEDVNPRADSPENDSTKSGLQHHVGTNQNLGTGSHDQLSPEHPPNQGGSYTETASSATSAIDDKAISAKNAVASKLGYGGGNNDQHEFVKPQDSSYQTTGTGQNLSTPENPSNEGKNVDTAISAKNVVASKLGYGGDTDQQQHGDHAAVGSGSAAPEQQGKGITAAVTEKPTTVYEKVAGAGSTLMSKLPGSTGTAGKEEVHQGTAATRGESDKAGKDQGVSEKLKPDEEDRALSEVISETLHERKAEQPPSDARPVGKVTETAEVTKQLGPDYGVEDVQQSGYGKVVADTIRGAFGSVFGKADQTTASPESLGSSTGTEGFSSSGTGVAERRGRGDESGK